MTDRYVTFHLGDALYGIEVQQVQEVMTQPELTRVPLGPPEVAGLINLRGQVVTALEMRVRTGLPPRPSGGPATTVVVRWGAEIVALLVDSIGDVVDVQPGGVESPPDTLTGPMAQLITGACQLPGQLLLTLDVARAVEVTTSV